MTDLLRVLPVLLVALCLACQDTDTQRIPMEPTVAILEPQGDDIPAFEASETIVFVASVDDEYDAPENLTVTWSSDYLDDQDTQTLDLGESGVDTNGRTTHPVSSLPSAVHTVMVTVTDTDGLSAYDTVVVEVLPGNAAPAVSIEEPEDGSTFLQGDVITFVASAQDDGGPETLTVTWTSNLDGEFDTEPPPDTGVLVVATADLGVGDHAIAVTVIDDSGLEAQDDVTIHVEEPNAAPSEPSVTIDPSDPTTTDDLTCVAGDSVDPNGDTVTYTYSWLSDGSSTGNTTDTVPAADTVLGEVWTCQVIPSDGMLEGPMGEASVTILPQEGDLVITELMLDPATVDDSVGEWFELYNASDVSIDLLGWILSDVNAGDSDVVSTSVVVVPGGYAVLANNWDPSTNGNVPVDYWYSGFSLDDTVDEIVLSFEGVEVDRVEYDFSAGWPALIEGQAMMLDTAYTDHASNDDPASWCGSTTPLGANLDFGTPGMDNDDCACFDSDADADGFGVDATCTETDCDDSDAAIYPDAPETCEDGVDSDCDGSDVYCDCTDTDNDGDGYGTGALCALIDCDDSDPAVFPGATETCNSIDDDCDGTADDGIDLDGDGYTGCGGDDCDDANSSIYPGAVETCNSVDDDCDGTADDGVDADGDGYDGCGGDDCDDTDAGVNPGATDVCDNVDVDCDGVDGNDEGGDSYETNDSYGSGHHLYTNNSTSTMSDAVTDATIHDASDEDWFYIYQGDPFGGWFGVQGTVSPPAGGSVYLELYKNGVFVDGGYGSQSVSHDGGIFDDDSANYDFRVVWQSGTPDPCETYTLSVSSSG